MDKLIITRLVLVNYIRMAEAGIVRFVYEPDSAYTLQLILGSNGSGKSSLMHMLWPLPADQNDFVANDGSFEIEFTYGGSDYKIASIFDGKARHHFIKDGVELNQDHKINACYALCEEHLRITNEIRSLALGYEKLTTMQPGRRRYWMVKLADTDFTYAMNRYKKLTDIHRDAQGSIRRLGKRVVDERAKMTPPDVVAQINREYREIRELIAEIYNKRNAEVKPSADIAGSLEILETEISGYCRDIDRFKYEVILSSGYKNEVDLEMGFDVTRAEIGFQKAALQKHFAEHSRIKRRYDTLVKAGNETIAELVSRKNHNLELIAFEKMHLCFPEVMLQGSATYKQAKEVFDIIHLELYEKINALPVNEGLYGRDKAEVAEGKVEFDRRNLNALEGRISRLRADISHQKDHVQKSTVSCPKCKHSWSSRASESDIENADKLLVTLVDDAEILKARIDENSKYIGEFNKYAEQYRDVIRTMKANTVLAPYFAVINKDNLMMKSPSAVANDLTTVGKDLFHRSEIERLEAIVKGAEEQIDLKKNMEVDTLDYLESELKLIEAHIAATTADITKLGVELKSISGFREQVNYINGLNKQMRQAYESRRVMMKDYIYSRYQEMLTELVVSLQTQLVRKEDVLSQITNQQNVLAELDSQLNEAYMNEKISRAAHMALSPTTGAIAEGLHRFMNAFASRMNNVIAGIWTTPLKILPFSLEEGQVDLDYKFPFKGVGEKPKKDVDEGSRSMLELFDFAFKRCALRQLKLDFIPVFLDEFEAAFDDTHRERVIYYIKKMIDEGSCGQIFTISHYESNHGALSGLAQTCVLSRDNLLLSTEVVYNEHVTIN